MSASQEYRDLLAAVKASPTLEGLLELDQKWEVICGEESELDPAFCLQMESIPPHDEFNIEPSLAAALQVARAGEQFTVNDVLRYVNVAPPVLGTLDDGEIIIYTGLYRTDNGITPW